MHRPGGRVEYQVGDPERDRPLPGLPADQCPWANIGVDLLYAVLDPRVRLS